MKRTNSSWNASADLGLMDTFLSRPQPKRWMFSQIAKRLRWVDDKLESLALDFEPREIHVNERLLEMPFVLQRVSRNERVLDVGTTSSALALQLACLGYQVTGIDVREYPFSHPNLNFHKEDISNSTIAKGSHDCAILISTLEHMGLGSYGDSTSLNDREFLLTVASFIRPEGRILVTVPFGKPFEGAWYRVYDSERFANLVSGFEVLTKEFYRRASLLSWIACREDELGIVASESLPINGAGLFELRKKQG